jgi:hypothetical protein
MVLGYSSRGEARKQNDGCRQVNMMRGEGRSRNLTLLCVGGIGMYMFVLKCDCVCERAWACVSVRAVFLHWHKHGVFLKALAESSASERPRPTWVCALYKKSARKVGMSELRVESMHWSAEEKRLLSTALLTP